MDDNWPHIFLGKFDIRKLLSNFEQVIFEYLTLLYLQQISEARTVILRKNLFHLLAPPPPSFRMSYSKKKFGLK